MPTPRISAMRGALQRLSVARRYFGCSIMPRAIDAIVAASIVICSRYLSTAMCTRLSEAAGRARYRHAHHGPVVCPE